MTTLYGLVLTLCLGWKIKGDFPSVSKSVIIFAPHTSYFDGVIGKLYLKEIGIRHKFISKKELFQFPLNYLMHLYGSMPVDHSGNYIFQISEMLSASDQLHIVMSPEGTRRKVNEWKRGFYYIAKRANVPIIIGYLDYQKKEIGILATVDKNLSVNEITDLLSVVYLPVKGKHPEKFMLS